MIDEIEDHLENSVAIKKENGTIINPSNSVLVEKITFMRSISASN